MENSDDILVWRDGFWCYRLELSPDLRRGGDYRVVARTALEWLAYNAKRAAATNNPARP